MSDKWEHEVKPTTVGEITTHAVGNKTWQSYRLAMKGKSTSEKLAMLRTWRSRHMVNGKLPRATEVQIDNYINALKRGGELSESGRIIH